MNIQEDYVLFARWPKIYKLLGGSISRSTIDRLEKKGFFPKRIKFGARIVVWNVQDVTNWMNQQRNKIGGF